MSFKIEIPVTPLVRTWLVKKYGESPDLSYNNSLGITLIYMINKGNEHHDSQVKLENYVQRITIKLSESVFFRYGYTLTPTSVCQFNKYVLEEIYGLMFYGIDLETLAKKKTIKDCIESFCDRHGISDDDFSFERAKKAYHRYRKRKNLITV